MERDHPICSIIPPYLLDKLCECDDDEIRQSAHKTLALGESLCQKRHEWFAARAGAHRGHTNNIRYGDGEPESEPPSYGQPRTHSHPHPHQRPHQAGPGPATSQAIIPSSLLESLAKSSAVDAETHDSAQRTLALSEQVRDDRASVAASAAALGFAVPTAATEEETTTSGFWRGVYDMQGKGDPDVLSTFDLLPGVQRRVEGESSYEPDTKVNEAYDNALHVLKLYEKFFGYKSLDNAGMKVTSSVHFGQGMGNAFWLGWMGQMVYGDGNAFIHNFTACIDVIGHEMTHAVTQYNSALIYEDESGALNEHISDAFGIMVKQMVEDETAENADWLIGEGCLLPGVKGVSLRNMKNPGTAYNDPRFGFDMQPAHYDDIPAIMKKYGTWIRTRDYGGVHVFSGIPNRAFTLAAIAFGGYTWEKAGQIWWRVVSKRSIPNNCTFIQFADATVDAALDMYGEEAAKIVRDAWNQVGVVRKV